ncbi:diguanylate cyclase [Acidihalobacter aeolianus]|uniref:Diguanylate cyclase n=2 Tax=Ectothiorhodospiraceae TaxID=72276 RepID=A0A1D8K550_9GAMM|nr:diguanylate cyclase [Acidihalobacter aeolianus]
MSDNIHQRHSPPAGDTQRFWGVMTFYERFEQVVALILTTVIAVIIVIALWNLIRQVFSMLVTGTLNPLDHSTFETVFGMIMTLLIALEFKHSILRVLERQEHIIQVRTVILIALLALARKFIVLDMGSINAAALGALGFASLALGVVYWLLRERHDRAQAQAKKRTQGSGDIG